MAKLFRIPRKNEGGSANDLGVICAVFGFVIVFVAVMTPILYLISRNKELEAQRSGKERS